MYFLLQGISICADVDLKFCWHTKMGPQRRKGWETDLIDALFVLKIYLLWVSCLN